MDPTEKQTDPGLKRKRPSEAPKEVKIVNEEITGITILFIYQNHSTIDP